MTQETCPTCGCHIGYGAYEKDDVVYCCQPCAEGGACECGDCEEMNLPTPLG